MKYASYLSAAKWVNLNTDLGHLEFHDAEVILKHMFNYAHV